MATPKVTDVATGSNLRKTINSSIDNTETNLSNSIKSVAVSGENIVTTKNNGSTSTSAVASNLTVTVSASTQAAISSGGSVGGGSFGGRSATVPTVVTGISANTYTLQNLLQQLVNKSHSHNAATITSAYNCYSDYCSSSSCIIRGKVLTDKGEIEIQDLKIGDTLLGIDGKYHKMVGMKLSKLGERQAVYFAGFNSAIFTDDHLFITAEGNYATYNKKGYLKESSTNLTDGKVYGTYSRSEEKEIINLKENNIVLRLVDGTKVCFLMEVNDSISYNATTYTPIVEDCEWIYVNKIPVACASKIKNND